VIVISFTLNFRNGGLPDLNLAGTCWGPNFPGTNLLQCLDVGKGNFHSGYIFCQINCIVYTDSLIFIDIKTCQSRGKTVLMSLGGAVGNYGFANNADAEAFADTLWNIYGAGSSNTRPFGDAILDGFDLDIEGGGPTGYAVK
jgi:chitinase